MFVILNSCDGLQQSTKLPTIGGNVGVTVGVGVLVGSGGGQAPLIQYVPIVISSPTLPIGVLPQKYNVV